MIRVINTCVSAWRRTCVIEIDSVSRELSLPPPSYGLQSEVGCDDVTTKLITGLDASMRYPDKTMRRYLSGLIPWIDRPITPRKLPVSCGSPSKGPTSAESTGVSR